MLLQACSTTAARSTSGSGSRSAGSAFSSLESSSRSCTSSCRRNSSRCRRSTSTALPLFTLAARLSPTSSNAVSGVRSSWATSLTQRSC